MAFKKKSDKKEKLSPQEENFKLMSVLGFPWDKAKELDEADKKFLLSKCDEIIAEHEARLKDQEEQQKEFTERVMANAQPNPDAPEPPKLTFN